MTPSPAQNPALDISASHSQNTPHWSGYSGTFDPEGERLRQEREAARAEAARREAELAAREAELAAERAAWLAVLSRGQAAQARVMHARQQITILERRLAGVEAEFDAAIGSHEFSADWAAAHRIDPLAKTDSHFFGTFNGIFPLEFLGGRVAALNEAISRARKLLVTYGADEASSLDEARRYAKQHGLDHDFGEGTEAAVGVNLASENNCSQSSLPDECNKIITNAAQARELAASPFVEIEAQEPKGRRKAK